jgi:hypothetical protein
MVPCTTRMHAGAHRDARHRARRAAPSRRETLIHAAVSIHALIVAGQPIIRRSPMATTKQSHSFNGIVRIMGINLSYCALIRYGLPNGTCPA